MPRDKLGKSCRLWYCNDKHYANGYCHRHYLNLRKYGNVVSPKNTDFKNVLRTLNELVYAVNKERPDIVVDVVQLINEETALNTIGRCNKCQQDKIATLFWPSVTISCGCPGESIVRLDEREFNLPDLFKI